MSRLFVQQYIALFCKTLRPWFQTCGIGLLEMADDNSWERRGEFDTLEVLALKLNNLFYMVQYSIQSTIFICGVYRDQN